MAKAALLLWVFMDLRAQPRLVKVLALAPLLLAPGFTIVLMLDVVSSGAGGAMIRVARAACANWRDVVASLVVASSASPAWALCPELPRAAAGR